MPLVKLYANLRNLADTKEVSIEEQVLAKLCTKLVKRNPALGGYLFENEQIRPHVIITINGHPHDGYGCADDRTRRNCNFPADCRGDPLNPLFFHRKMGEVKQEKL